MQHITVLGSTGSIGTNTLDVIGRHSSEFNVFALTAATQVETIFKQIARFLPTFAVMVDPNSARALADKVAAEHLPTTVLSGPEALLDVSSDPRVDAVMAAIVGAAGLRPCMAAARAGKRLLLANKEALVVGGSCFMDAVAKGRALLLPIDSEHSAIFQSLPDDPSTWKHRVEKIVLTASGGPFRARDASTFSRITPEEACAHPNWVMGRKISVDSASMMNKALEVVEAHYLFGLPPESVEVVVHPQSVVHSMVQYRDRSVVAQLGTPDMRVPIAYGLSWPDRLESGAAQLDFSTLTALTFEPPDFNKFPGLQLAWECLRAQSGTTAVLNAANEVAVEAFLNRDIRFDQIHWINSEVLERFVSFKASDETELLETDMQARHIARTLVNELKL